MESGTCNGLGIWLLRTWWGTNCVRFHLPRYANGRQGWFRWKLRPRIAICHLNPTLPIILNGHGQSTTVSIHNFFRAHVGCQEYIILCSVTYYHQEHIRDVPIPVKQVVIARRLLPQEGYTFMTWFQFNPSPYWWTIRGAHCHSQRHKEAWGFYDVPWIYIRGKYRRNCIAPQGRSPKDKGFSWCGWSYGSMGCGWLRF